MLDATQLSQCSEATHPLAEAPLKLFWFEQTEDAQKCLPRERHS